MKLSTYTALAQDERDADAKSPLHSWALSRSLARWRWIVSIMTVVLLASISTNIYLLSQRLLKPWELSAELPTRYEIVAHTIYDSLNRTEQDAAWDDRDVEPWNGMIAVDEDYALGQGLPHSQRWPWDTSKGVYILTSSHELHCVRVLRTSVNQNHDQIPRAEQTWQYKHLMHCLNVLRESVMCHADDTPLYVGRLHKNVLSEETPKAGVGTIKMCRDWNALLKWSRARSACYRPVHWGEPGFHELERYKSCPDGARPWEGIEEVH